MTRGELAKQLLGVWSAVDGDFQMVVKEVNDVTPDYVSLRMHVFEFHVKYITSELRQAEALQGRHFTVYRMRIPNRGFIFREQTRTYQIDGAILVGEIYFGGVVTQR